MSLRLLLATCLVALLGALAPIHAQVPTRGYGVPFEYDVTIMGEVPGAYLTYSAGMNDHGKVVGMAMFIPGGLKGWTWSKTEGFVVMPQPPTITDFGAVDINNAGVIAGDGGGDSGEIWRYANGAYEMLGVLPGTPIPQAEGISATGTITGTCFGTLFYNPRHSFIAIPGAAMASALDNSQAYHINDFDQITGVQSNTAFRLTPGVGLELLPPLGGKFLTAGYSINNLGGVVGVASSTVEHSGVPFLFTDGGGMQEIGNFGGRALASDVNDFNEVIGDYEPSSGVRKPWVWSKRRGVRFLGDEIDPTLNLRMRYTKAINNAGEIVCDARDQNSTIVQVFLTPRFPRRR